MHSTRRSLVRSLPRSLVACALALSAAFTTSDLLVAQVVQANYPLLTDLTDTSLNYGDVILLGNPPPSAPNNGVCLNGVHQFGGGANWQDFRTPNIGTLDTDDFELEIDFQVAAFSNNASSILVGGNGWRWIGFRIQSDGTFGVMYNNTNYTWSTTRVTIGTWHSGVIKYEAGTVQLFLDGVQVHQDTIPALVTGNDLCFTPTDFSNASHLINGCLRNLKISNDTTLGPISPSTIGTAYCSPAVANSSGASAITSASGSANVGANMVTLHCDEMPMNSFGFFLTSTMQGLVNQPGGSQGVLCLGGSIERFVSPGQVQNSGGLGSIEVLIDLTMHPTPTGLVQVMPGETWNFTAWFRDAVGGSATSNFADGLEITFM